MNLVSAFEMNSNQIITSQTIIDDFGVVTDDLNAYIFIIYIVITLINNSCIFGYLNWATPSQDRARYELKKLPSESMTYFIPVKDEWTL